MDQTVQIRSTDGWTLQQTLVGHADGVTSVAFSPDGQRIATGCMDGTVKVWDANGTCLVTVAAHALPVTAALFSTDGSCVISGSDDGSVRLWSAVNGSARCTLGGQNSFIGSVAFSPDGALCACSGGDGIIHLYHASDGSVVRTLAGNTNYVSSLAFAPESARLASGGGPLDPTIKIWKISDGSLLNTIAATTNGVMALSWSPDGSTLAAGGDSIEQTITLWSTNAILLGTLPGHANGVTALAFSPRGDSLASGGRRPDNTVRIWRLADGSVARAFSIAGTGNNVECLTFSPDGSCVAYGSSAGNVLGIGQVSSGLDVALGSGTSPVSSVAYSPDGRTLAATSPHMVQIWTNGPAWNAWARTETITQEIVRASCLAYSPNGNLFLCGREDGTLTMSPNTFGALGRPPLTFTSLRADADGTAEVRASVQPWARYLMQSSTNMATWTYLTQTVSATSDLSLTIPSAPDTPNWYLRVVTPP
jgi:WD40 repeat protein